MLASSTCSNMVSCRARRFGLHSVNFKPTHPASNRAGSRGKDMTTTDQTGRVLAGRYRIEAELGTGSSARVWRAFDLRLSRLVAVKLLHPGLAADEGFLRRFRPEAQTVAQVNHRHGLSGFDWGQ